MNGDMVDLQFTLGQQLFDIALGKSVAQVPSHYKYDHLPREPEAGERRSRREDRTNTAAVAHALDHSE